MSVVALLKTNWPRFAAALGAFFAAYQLVPDWKPAAVAAVAAAINFKPHTTNDSAQEGQESNS